LLGNFAVSTQIALITVVLLISKGLEYNVEFVFGSEPSVVYRISPFALKDIVTLFL